MAKKVEEYGYSSEVIAQFLSEHFADYPGDIRGKTIGIARAEVPNPELTISLESKGAAIIEALAFRIFRETGRLKIVYFPYREFKWRRRR
ncbi:MAG: hypothetical protein Q8O41_06500 [Candidatus Methanoperedens sp.]|nr:hypothetical protein [Candidatus Methanoperedens sp.]